MIFGSKTLKDSEVRVAKAHDKKFRSRLASSFSGIAHFTRPRMAGLDGPLIGTLGCYSGTSLAAKLLFRPRQLLSILSNPMVLLVFDNWKVPCIDDPETPEGFLTTKDVWINCYCTTSSAQKDVKLLPEYTDFYGCIPLRLWFDINSQFYVKKIL